MITRCVSFLLFDPRFTFFSRNRLGIRMMRFTKRFFLSFLLLPTTLVNGFCLVDEDMGRYG